MESSDLREILANFHNVALLLDWAEKNNLLFDQRVQQRINDILFFQQQTTSRENEELWQSIVSSFETEEELLNFARMNQCLYDTAVQNSLQKLRQVSFW